MHEIRDERRLRERRPAPAAAAAAESLAGFSNSADECVRVLRAKIEARTARVGVIGVGAVGLPLCECLLEAGFSVLAFDSDEHALAELRSGESTLAHFESSRVRTMLATRRFVPSAEHDKLAELDIALICVPTPLDARRAPDLSHVRAVGAALAEHAPAGRLVVLESTSYPGTTREVLGAIFRAAGARPGEDVFLAYSPEREDPGRPNTSTRTIPKLVGGTCERSSELAQAFYRTAIECVHLVSRAEVAEAAKLFENVFRSVNIALVNELKLIAHEQGLDPWEVLDAAATKPFGFLPFAPGPGMGGHCIPKDPHYYAWAAEAAGVRSRFVALADETNRAMPAYVCERTRAALFERSVELAGARVLLLGLAYKAEVGIVAESPALALAELFHARAARVSFSDPHVASVPQSSRACFESARSLEFDLEVLAGFDALVVCTDHQAFDWELIARTDVLVIDTRNALALRMRGRANYRRA